MQRIPVLTNDGSVTIRIPEKGITFHSHHGAIQESQHVFIDAGLVPRLHQKETRPIRILEAGFGTGLNVLLTLIAAENTEQPVQYTTLELFPLEDTLIPSLNYCSQLQRPDLQALFSEIHTSDWEKEIALTPSFTLLKKKQDLLLHQAAAPYDIVYYDAFAPTVQPEVWTQQAFEQMYTCMATGGVLLTYCSKSIVRQAMKAAGLQVKKIPGPWGKREMVSAYKH